MRWLAGGVLRGFGERGLVGGVKVVSSHEADGDAIVPDRGEGCDISWRLSGDTLFPAVVKAVVSHGAFLGTPCSQLW